MFSLDFDMKKLENEITLLREDVGEIKNILTEFRKYQQDVLEEIKQIRSNTANR